MFYGYQGKGDVGIDKPHKDSVIVDSSLYVLGTFAIPPKESNGAIDFIKLLNELEEIHADTYVWRVSHKNSKNGSFEDFKRFLPLAEKKAFMWGLVSDLYTRTTLPSHKEKSLRNGLK